MSDSGFQTLSAGDTKADATTPLLSGRLNRAIAVLAMVMLCLLWSGVAWVISQDRRQTVAEAVHETENLTHAFEEHVSAIMSGLDHLLQLVRLQYVALGAKLDLPRLVEQIAVPKSVLQIGVLDARGQLLHSNLPFRAIDLSDREYYRFHRDNDTVGLNISRPIYGRLSSKLVLQLSMRMNASDGTFAGVVMLSLDPLYLAEFYQQLPVGRGGLATVVGTDGVVRARHDGQHFTLGQDVRESPLFGHLSSASEGAYVSEGPIDGARRFLSYRVMRAYPLVLMVGRPEKEVLKAFFTRRTYVLTAGLAGTLLIVGSAWWLMVLSRRQSLQAREVQNSRALLRAFMDSVPDWGWLKDGEGRFIAVNRSYARTIGADPKDIVGRTDFELFDEALARKHRQHEEYVIATGQIVRFETAVEKDGSERWVETIKAPVYDDKAGVSATCGVSRDITDRKRAEADAREMNRALELRAAELAEVNRELDAYTYTVSHDLHAPLRHISGFTRLLRDHLSDYPDVRVQRLFDKVAQATDRMDSMIDDLLAFSRSSRSALHHERVALDAVVGDIVEEFRTAMPERTIDWRVGPLPVVDADRKLVQLAFYNLISNAVKYTATRSDAVIEIALIDRGSDDNAIYVRDNGAGFDMKNADRLFGVFERLHDDREFKGTGIGLATVKRIIGRHGGRVWAEGSAGVGATFYVAMPVHMGQSEITEAGVLYEKVS